MISSRTSNKTIQTYGKNGVLEIIGNPQETMLFLNDKPIQYSWYAEIGTTWRYHIARGLKKKAIPLSYNIEGSLKSEIKNEDDFRNVAKYFVNFLKYGTYEYGYYEMFKELNWIEIPEDEEYSNFDYYGGCLDISPTQNAINTKLVEEYKEQILKGVRPIIILIHVENSWMFHILDGHHKFCAYGRAKVKPHAIIITKIGNEYKSVESTIELAKKMNCTIKKYIDCMRDEKANLKYYKSQKIDLEKEFRRIKIDDNIESSS